MTRHLIILACAIGCFVPSMAQTIDKADVTVAFDLSQQGKRFTPTWGLDQAWINEQFMRKGINHMGRENVGIGRTCFRFSQALINDSALNSSVVSVLSERNKWLNLAGNDLPIVLTADQEAGAHEYFVVNRSCNVERWAAMINSHVHWLQKNTKHPVVGISPFNEPDCWTTEEGATVEKSKEVARLLKENYPRMADVAIVGGNTLNDDKALEWYNGGKDYYSWGNTHQLAGSFDNYANFYTRLKNDGKTGYNDEMHNVAEAIIGLEYGMTVGIWWGFDSRARGEFCQLSRNGERLAYGEQRAKWTAASVYRHDDGRVRAFIGSSERQALTTSYQFVSLDRDVYFDGYGPTRQFRMEIPGGSGYQKGQTNAERVIDITFGEDVPPTPITSGTYKIVNKTNGRVATVSNGKIALAAYNGDKSRQWNITPSDPRIGGDYSFYDFILASDGKTRMNLENFSTLNMASIIAWSQNDTPSSNEQWYFEYAGNGYYYIRNRESAFCLSAPKSGVYVVQQVKQTKDTEIDRQLWRILPVDVDYETQAPGAPAALSATPVSTSVSLSWNVPAENNDDIAGYMVLRADDGADNWNTIARGITDNEYVDNTCVQGRTYQYKVKAIDRALNASEASDVVVATAGDGHRLTAHWTLDASLDDVSGNRRHAAAALSTTFNSGREEATKALYFNSRQWLQVPASGAASDELTVAMWVKVTSSAAWQRFFDFGYDTDHYFFLTPSTGSVMRFAIKNGGEEQHVDCPTRLTTGVWKHVALTMKQNDTRIYVDGEQVASSSDITISPADVRPVIGYLGRSMFNADPFLSGYMQDVRIYNYALAADDVKNLFDGKTAVGQELTAEPRPSSVYSLDGRKLEKPKKGLNIIDGKVRVQP